MNQRHSAHSNSGIRSFAFVVFTLVLLAAAYPAAAPATLAAQPASGAAPQNPSIVTVEVTSDTITTSLNGPFIRSITDTNPLPAARIGLGVISDWHTHFDDVTVTASLPSNTGTALTSSPNPSLNGQPVTLTAAVTSTLGTPTGVVSFTVDSTTVATRTLVSGRAGYTTSSLALGAHQIWAEYGGEAPFEPSTSVPIVHMVNPARAFLPVVFMRWPPVPGTLTLNPILQTGHFSHQLDWTAADLATSYMLEEDHNAAFGSPVAVYNGPGQSWQSGTKTPGTYCYRARGWNSYGSGPWSNVQCITVTPCVPSYSDDFSNPASGWPVSDNAIRTLGYIDGEYRILIKLADYTSWVWDDFGISDYRLEVDARAAGHPNGNVSLYFGGTDAGFYLFRVSNGAFGLWRVERASWTWTNLIGWTPSPAIHTGTQSNRLKVVRSGASIALYVNGTPVGSAVDGVYTGTWLGINAGAATANFDGRFDNFTVYSGDCINPSADLMSPGLLPLPHSYGTDCEVDGTLP